MKAKQDRIGRQERTQAVQRASGGALNRTYRVVASLGFDLLQLKSERGRVGPGKFFVAGKRRTLNGLITGKQFPVSRGQPFTPVVRTGHQPPQAPDSVLFRRIERLGENRGIVLPAA